MNTHRSAPDPIGLAVGRGIRQKVHPAEIIPCGSQAAGHHCPDSDRAQRTRAVLKELLEAGYACPGRQRVDHHREIDDTSR